MAGCKGKIEFDRCRWERKAGRKGDREERERERERMVAQVRDADDGLIGWIRSSIVGGKERRTRRRGWKERGASPSEGRKNERKGGRNYSARREIESTRRREDREDFARTERQVAGVKLRTFGDNYRRRADRFARRNHRPSLEPSISRRSRASKREIYRSRSPCSAESCDKNAVKPRHLHARK